MLKKICFFLIVVIFFSCKKDVTPDLIKENGKNKSKGVNVKTALIENVDFQKQIISNGKIKALKKSELRFKTNERLSAINVQNGQKVKKGQILAYLDNDLLKNQLLKAEIEFDKAKNKLLEEKINYGLDDSSSIKITPDVLKSLQIKSGYLEAQNALANNQLLYKQTFLRAPFHGIAANIEINEGDYITSSDVFCTIINPTQLEVLFSIMESDIDFIYKKQRAEIVPFAVGRDKKYRASITEINPLVSENGLIKVKAKIDTIDTSLFHGMNVKVFINHPIENVIVIPKEALVLRSNKEVVFTIKDNLAKWNFVEVLGENSTAYAIKKGVKLGDTIIVSGNMNLSHDAHVNATFIPREKYNN